MAIELKVVLSCKIISWEEHKPSSIFTLSRCQGSQLSVRWSSLIVVVDLEKPNYIEGASLLSFLSLQFDASQSQTMSAQEAMTLSIKHWLSKQLNLLQTHHSPNVIFLSFWALGGMKMNAACSARWHGKVFLRRNRKKQILATPFKAGSVYWPTTSEMVEKIKNIWSCLGLKLAHLLRKLEVLHSLRNVLLKLVFSRSLYSRNVV